MKKRLVIGLCMMTLVMTACGNQGTESAEDSAVTSESEETADTEETEETGEAEESSDASDGMESQLAAFAQQKDVWAVAKEDFADRYYYTLTDMQGDGSLTLMTSQFGGTGFFTYSHFYQVDENGNVVEIANSFTEEQSQPDLIDEGTISVYCDEAADPACYYFVVHDQEKVEPTLYRYETGAISVTGDGVIYETLAVEMIEYVGEEFDASVTYEDAAGNALTEEEYNSFAESYYTGMGYSKGTCALDWSDAEAVADMSEEEIVTELAGIFSEIR